MHIAIDDTYGQAGDGTSRYVTKNRRTHLAVVFPDDEVAEYRKLVQELLAEVNSITKFSAPEFHFVDIYNRNGEWQPLREMDSDINLQIFEQFADIYAHYKWPVFIQTVDDRTLRDHGIAGFDAKIDGLDLKKRDDLSLFFLLTKIKSGYVDSAEKLTLLIDEGRQRPGAPFGQKIFHDWRGGYSGQYQSTKAEPLLQIADFLAFCVNRSTHLSLKSARTELDNWFLELAGSMQIDCKDLMHATVDEDFEPGEIDALHHRDRVNKGLEPE